MLVEAVLPSRGYLKVAAFGYLTIVVQPIIGLCSLPINCNLVPSFPSATKQNFQLETLKKRAQC